MRHGAATAPVPRPRPGPRREQSGEARLTADNLALRQLANERATILKALDNELADLIADGVLTTDVRRRLRVLVMPSAVLFASGESALEPAVLDSVKRIGVPRPEVALMRLPVMGVP